MRGRARGGKGGEGSRERRERRGKRVSRWRMDVGEGNGGGSEKVRNRVLLILVSALVRV